MTEQVTETMRFIAGSTNDEALLFFMFRNDKANKGMIYSSILNLPNGLTSQYATERRVRAQLHLIKRAMNRGNISKASDITQDMLQTTCLHFKFLIDLVSNDKQTVTLQ